MTFVLLPVEHVIAIHDHELDGNELQGMVSGKFLDGALGRVETRLNYGLVEDVFALAASAASYAAAISQAHCFNDENKRAAFQVMDLVLDLNGVQIDWSIESVGRKIILFAQSKLDEGEFAAWLRAQRISR